MIFNSSANVKLGATLVTRVSGDTWHAVNQPAFFRTSAFPQLYMIAEVDQTDGQWIQLCRPFGSPSQTNIPVEICMDYTAEQNLPIGNIGDVDMADLYNRALLVLDRAPTSVPLHGPSHVGLGLDPIPLASTTDSGLVGRLSGLSTDYVGGDNICHQMAGVPTGTMVAFAGPVIPANWLLCDGRLVARSAYNNLYIALGSGSVYGNGDGLTNFPLPDCRGRVFVGAGSGAGVRTWQLAEKYGEDAHVLSQNELASHGHGVSQDPHTHTIAHKWFGSQKNVTPGPSSYWVYQATVENYNEIYASYVPNLAVQAAGGNWGHNTIQASLGTNIIIRT